MRQLDAANDYGRHIYAYCNVRTNQVLYSLTQSLKHRALRQLPDAGANNNPPKLRKDSWKPLYAVSLPLAAQGLEAFRKLREYRKLHETCWTPPEELKRNKTEKEVEKMQEKLDDRGGSKKETVWDLIKREKKKIRAKQVLDQKANSIADLAAVLAEQERRGAQTEEKQVLERGWDRKNDIKEMYRLVDEAKEGGVRKLEARIEEVKAITQKELSELQETGVSRSAAKKELYDLHRKRLRMQFAVEAFAQAEKAIKEGTQQELLKQRQIEAHLRAKGLDLAEVQQEIADAEAEVQPLEVELAKRINIIDAEVPDQIANLDRKIEQLQAGYVESEEGVQIGVEGETLPRQLDPYLHLSENDRRAAVDFLSRKKQALQALPAEFKQAKEEEVQWAASSQNGGDAATERGRSLKYKYLETSLWKLSEDAREGQHFTEELQELYSGSFEWLVQAYEKEEANLQHERHVRAKRDRVTALRKEFGVGTEFRPSTISPAELAGDLMVKKLAKMRKEMHAFMGKQSKDVHVIIKDVESNWSQMVAECDKEIEHWTARMEKSQAGTTDEQGLTQTQLQRRASLARKRKLQLSTTVDALREAKAVVENDGVQALVNQLKLLVPKKYDLWSRRRAAKKEGENSNSMINASDLTAMTCRINAMKYVIAANSGLKPWQDSLQSEKTSESSSHVETAGDPTAPGKVQQSSQEGDIAKPSAAATESKDGKEGAVEFASLLPFFPARASQSVTHLPKKGHLKGKIRRLNAPVFTTEGVTVKWNDILDAEFAESWPSNVSHQRMGLNRFTAPRLDKEPVLEVADWHHGKDWEEKRELESSYVGELMRERKEKAAAESDRQVELVRSSVVSTIEAERILQERLETRRRKEARRARKKVEDGVVA